MKIYVALANPKEHLQIAGWLDVFCQLAKNDRWGRHTLVSDPESSDCILFIDAHVSLSVDYYRIVDEHPLTKKFPEKVMVYDESDRPPSYGRGLYVSVPKGLYDPTRHSIVCYWHNFFDAMLPSEDRDQRTNYCFFAGAVSYNPTRSRIVKQLSGSVVTVRDTSSVSPWKTGKDAPTSGMLKDSREEYSRLMLENKYCLAPRGKGTASIRLFEAISHNTVPIVMSDDYVNPKVPEWDRAVVTHPQRKPKGIIHLMDSLQAQFPSRQTFVKALSCNYFGPDSRWNFYGDQLERLLEQGAKWQRRTYNDAYRTRAYWLIHRLYKKLEGYTC